jgi:serine phosphatase RsbU (regulator of sigma subunit)
MRIVLNILIFLYSFSLFAQDMATHLNGENAAKETEYIKAINKFKSEGNANIVASYYNKLGYLYWETNNAELAIESFNQSVSYNHKIGNKNALKTLYSNLGMIYSDAGNYESSLLNFRKSLKISEQLNNKADIASGLMNLAVTLSFINRTDEAISNLERALLLAKELKDMKLLRSCYGMLHENYQKVGNSEKSFEYFNLYASFDKEIQKIENKQKDVETKKKINQISQEKQKVEAEKQQTEVELKKTEENLEIVEELNRKKQMELELKELTVKEQKAQLRVQKMVLLSIIGFAFLLLFIAFIIYRSYKQKKQANLKLGKAFAQINKQNENIKKSINYAQRIQGAMLPPSDNLKNFLPESFVFFKPRDVVSGDFYYFSETKLSLEKSKSLIFSKEESTQKGVVEDIVVSAVDCTGHGVPGAFMSLIGYNIISEILSRDIIEVDQILNELHKGVKNSLKQEQTENKDGMDLAFCRIRMKDNEVDFSGAKNPLVYIQNNELKQIKGNRFGVGGAQKEEERTFNKHTVKVDQPTTFYIFSDGFPDQFGGPDGEKYMIKLFKDFLLEIHNKPFNEQEKLLEKRLNDWMGKKYSQVDDILVIGFKLNPR